MIVGYVLKMYPRFSETFILNEILELERQGVEVRIFSLHKPNDGRFHARLAKVQAKVTYLPEYPQVEPEQVRPACWNLFRHDPGRFLKTLWYSLTHPNGMGYKRFLRVSVLADQLLKEPVDHLHAHFASSATSAAMLAHMLTGISYSFTAHAKDIYLDSLDPHLLRDKMQAARFVVTVSDFNLKHLMELSDGKDGTAAGRPLIQRLYNGIDLNQFSPRSGWSPETAASPLILSVGRLVEKKGFEDLIRACALLRDQGIDFRCEIIGKGPREKALRELIARLDLAGSVHLLGPRPQDEVVAAYERATVFALPCIIGEDGNRDGLPTVLLEAMAMGIPAVSTSLTGVPEIIDNGITGLLVSPGDPSALAAALARLLGDPALRKSMGRQARLKVGRQFDLRRNVSILRDWFESPAGGESFEQGQLARSEVLEDSLIV